MKLKITIIFCLLVSYLQLSSAFAAQQQKWCWTKSQVNNPGFILDNAKGGFNWGFCTSKELSDKQTTTYSVSAVTSNTPGSLTDSSISIRLCGKNGCFDKFYKINSSGFNVQGVREQGDEFEAKDVGQLQKMTIKLDGSKSWQCKEIFVAKDGVETKFECLRKLEPCSVKEELCRLDSLADGAAEYQVTIKTGDEKEDENPGPVNIVLIGSKNTSQGKIFTDMPLTSFNDAMTSIQTEDIGDIKGFRLILKGEGKWRPTMVKIKSELTGEEKTFDLKNAILTYPGNNTYEEKDDSVDGGSGGSGGDKDDELNVAKKNLEKAGLLGKNKKGQKKKETLNVHNPNGGFLNFNDRSSIIELTCEQIMVNTNINLFGPDYPTKNNEYKKVLARCPADCHKTIGTVFGLGIHPSSSPICLSAIIDNAMSYYGGIINISILPGLDTYKVPEDYKDDPEDGISVKTYDGEDSLKSYSLSKVDNIDLVEKDYRIVNSEGALSNIGRIEVRLGGEWGSICNMGNNANSAKILCKDLGYKDGAWLSKESEPQYCENHEGRNFCGAKQAKIHFSNLDCTLKDVKFETCNKNFADRQKCDYTRNSIIHCYNENYATEVKIPQKNVKLDAVKEMKETNEIIGRLEMYSLDKYLPVCHLKFDNQVANLACKTMGYAFGTWVRGEEAKPFKNENDTELGFSASELKCKPTATNLKGCSGNFSKINCSHDMDVVVKCTGDKGDYTGKSQFQPKVTNNPPQLSKLGLPDVKATCNLRGTDEQFRGDPGSIYKVCCPGNCKKEPGTVWGTGLFSGDSSVCLASLQTGILNDKEAGCFVLTKSHVNDMFKSTNINQIESINSQGTMISTFHVNEMNSGWENMNRKFSSEKKAKKNGNKQKGKKGRNKKASFLETMIESYTSEPKEIDNLIYSSFLELAVPHPVFTFVEKDPNHTFSESDNLSFEGGKLTKVNDFTIFTMFEMQEFKGEESVLFSFRGTDGFNIYIDETDELRMGDMTNNKNNSHLSFIVPLKTKITLFINYKKGKLNYIINSNNGPSVRRNDVLASLDIPIEGKIGLGRLALAANKTFTGKIDFLEIYPQALPFEAIPTLLDEIKKRKNSHQLSKDYTLDQRECLSPCMSSLPMTGNPPAESVLNAPVSTEAKTEGIITFGEDEKEENDISKINGPEDIKNRSSIPSVGGVVSPSDFKDPEFPGQHNLSANNLESTSNLEPLICDEDTTLEDVRFKLVAFPKRFFRVSCPAMDPQAYFPVYGFAIYRANSSICRAAMHFGKLNPKEKKDVIVRVDGVQQAYNGSIGQHGIQSEDVLETEKKLSFTIEEAKNLKKIDCNTTLRSHLFANIQLGEIYVVECPANCSQSTVSVFGGNTDEADKCNKTEDNSASGCEYSDDTGICKAGIHCGVLNNLGGFIELKIDGEQSKFIGTTSFGIISKEKEGQVRSFTFIGQRSAIYTTYKESFNGSLLENWVVEKAGETKNTDRDSWQFYNNPFTFKNKEGKKESIRSIKHEGTISTQKPNTAASIIKKRNTEFANGLIKFNLMFFEIDPIFVYLRYVDKDNHIGLMINNKNLQNNFTLFITLIGSTRVLDIKNIPMEVKSWSRFNAYLYSDSIKITIQLGKIREHKVLFSTKINGLSRGTLAFGTNGNNHFYLSGISIEPFIVGKEEQSSEANKYSWNNILSDSKVKNKVNSFCKKNFKNNVEELATCQLPQFYCRYRCDNQFNPELFGILHLSCVKDCLTAMKEAANAINDNKPKPKVYAKGEKVDFKPKDSIHFHPASIADIIKKGEVVWLKVEYQNDTNDTLGDEIVSTDASVDKCGFKLKKRFDCNHTNSSPDDKVDDLFDD